MSVDTTLVTFFALFSSQRMTTPGGAEAPPAPPGVELRSDTFYLPVSAGVSEGVWRRQAWEKRHAQLSDLQPPTSSIPPGRRRGHRLAARPVCRTPDSSPASPPMPASEGGAVSKRSPASLRRFHLHPTSSFRLEAGTRPGSRPRPRGRRPAASQKPHACLGAKPCPGKRRT